MSEYLKPLIKIKIWQFLCFVEFLSSCKEVDLLLSLKQLT